MKSLLLLEQLVQTPSEVVGKPEFVLGMMPGGWLVYLYDDQDRRTDLLVPGSPGRIRDKRRYSVWSWEQEARQQIADEESAARREL